MTTKAPATGRSLRLELLASLAMVLVLAVVSLSFGAELLGQRRHRDLEIERIRDHTAGLASLAAMRLGGGSAEARGMDELVQQALGSSNGTLAVELHVIGSSAEPQRLALAGAPLTNAPPLSREARVHTEALADSGVVVVDEPLPTFEGPTRIAVLRVTAELSAWSRSAAWPSILMVAAGVALVFSLLGTILLDAQVLRPLRALKAGVAAVARGDFSTRVEVRSSRELHDLTSGFNEMTAALSRQHAELGQQAGALQRTEHMAAVGRLSAGVAHEVGNPLAALLGYTELLLDPRSEPPLGEEQRELLTRVHSQTERIQSIVGQLLDYSRQHERSLSEVDLRETAEETVALLRVDPANKGVEIELLGSGARNAWADRGLVTQVILNLGMNACRAALDADAPAKVRVAFGETTPDKGPAYSWIEVRDSGSGIPEAVREQIFEPFFTTRQAGEGTGLGLAISRSLVESLDGRLICTAEKSLLGGACFRMELPRDAPAET